MSSVCILTDSAAQFPQLGFPGRNDVRVISYTTEINGNRYEEGQELKTSDLPPSANEALHPCLIAPSVEKFRGMYTSLSQHYQEIIVILTSANLTQAFQNAREAENFVQGRVKVTVIDSQTTSVGLGLLVQTAAESVARGRNGVDIERIVRSVIPHTYMMVCTPGLSYLYYSGIVDQAQAFVGEMLGLMPIFTLEEGQISAVEKVRNTRGLVDFMQEFVLEFDELLHIAFIQSVPAMSHEARLMREHAQASFPQTPFSEHSINPALATLLGPRTIGLVAVEKPDGFQRG
jgi:DegV family protein with EDD domain